MPYTQEELNSIWQKLSDDPARDGFGWLDVGEMVKSFSLMTLGARVSTNKDTEQAIALGGAIDAITEFDLLSDEDSANDARGVYARRRDNKEGPWGEWKKR